MYLHLQIYSLLFTCLYIDIDICTLRLQYIYHKNKEMTEEEGSDLDRFTGGKPQGVGGLGLPGRSVLQEVDGVVADGLQVRSSLLLLRRGLGEGRGLDGSAGAVTGAGVD